MPATLTPTMTTSDTEEDTETKLAILSSIFTSASQNDLFDVLIRAEGRIPQAIDLYLDNTAAESSASNEPPAKCRKHSDPTAPSRNSEGKTDAIRRLKWTDSAEPARKVRPPLPPLNRLGDSLKVSRQNITPSIFIIQNKSPP